MPRKEEEEAQHCTKADKKKIDRVISCRTLHNKAGSAADTLYSPLPGSICGVVRGDRNASSTGSTHRDAVICVASFVKLFLLVLFFVCVVALALCSCVSVLWLQP